jgi:ABC-2 type transport system ATP-binding protein
VLLTTHYLEEAEQLCDRIAIINHGRLIANDSTEGMLRRLDQKELALTLARDLAEVPLSLRRYAAELQNPRRLVLRYRLSEAKVSDILSAASAAGLEIVDLTTEEADPASGLRAAGR